jgi:hypothetical protein
MAAVKFANCIGVVSTSPCPMALEITEEAFHR